MRRTVIAACLMLSGCQTPESAWLDNQRQRCAAMGGTHHYDSSSKQIECWRHPIARQTKLLFRETFNK